MHKWGSTVKEQRGVSGWKITSQQETSGIGVFWLNGLDRTIAEGRPASTVSGVCDEEFDQILRVIRDQGQGIPAELT